MGCCCSRLEREISEKFTEDEIVKKNVGGANLLVLTTQDCCKVELNGALVLTRERLWFRFICCGGDELDIPLNMIVKAYASNELNMPGIYLSTCQPMLIIEFSSELAAFSITDAETWAEQIEMTRSPVGRYDFSLTYHTKL